MTTYCSGSGNRGISGAKVVFAHSPNLQSPCCTHSWESNRSYSPITISDDFFSWKQALGNAQFSPWINLFAQGWIPMYVDVQAVSEWGGETPGEISCRKVER